MPKLVAILNVIAWSGFWAFGYLAFTADVTEPRQMTVAAIMAALGGMIGLWTYFKLIRHSETSGYAKQRNRADRSHLEQEYIEENS